MIDLSKEEIVLLDIALTWFEESNCPGLDEEPDGIRLERVVLPELSARISKLCER